MTVTYTGEVATSGIICLLKLLFKWRGSVYKLLWKDSILFFLLYYLLMLLYYFVLDSQQKKTFEKVVLYFRTKTNHSLVVFVLGFYINIIITRWWNQITSIPWPDRMAMFVTANVRGLDERGRLMRRTIMRYFCLASVITLSSISPVVKKRFPTFRHMTEAGLLLASEQQIIDKIKTPHNKFFVPLAWSTSLIQRARLEGRIKDDFGVKTLNDEVNDYRGMLGSLLFYDWIPIPLVYTQVVAVAVHVFTVFCILGGLVLEGDEGELGIYFPLFASLQYVFYMGYLKVAECLLNPFGEDDEDIDLNVIIDRNLQVSYLIVDEMHNEHPELIRDQYWDEVQFEIPYTDASAPFRRESFLGSAMKLELKEMPRFASKATLQSDEGGHNCPLEGDNEIIRRHHHGSRFRPKTIRQSSVSTDGSSSFRLTIDGGHDKNEARKTPDCLESLENNGIITIAAATTTTTNNNNNNNNNPSRQDSCEGEMDATKTDGVKVESEEVKNRLDAVKTTLEPLMEGDEQIQKQENLLD